MKRVFNRSDEGKEDAPATPEADPTAGFERSVDEERHETLTLLELKHASRDEKLRAERAMYEGAGDVAFTEQRARRGSTDSLDAIRNAVDAWADPNPPLAQPEPATPAAAPEPEPPAPEPTPKPPVAAPEPEPTPEPPAAEPEREPTPEPPRAEKPGRTFRPLTDEERDRVRAHVPGRLDDLKVLYGTNEGRVVEARFKSADGTRGTQIFTLRDDSVRPLDEIQDLADRLMPREAVAPASPEPAAETAAKPAKRMKLFGRKGKDDAPPAPEPEEADEPDDKPKKRFSLRRGRDS